ncbi:MAG: helix-hairpin-helix domain-containing protein [Azoarcus sp.]|jgi:competence protein ComEA|nr:helix-hairpin-helix domain-containing protein [Azoarcus sp.]
MLRFLRSLLLSLALCPLAAMALEPVNINTADTAALQQINGIGPSKANAIIEYRKEHGPFASVDDLVKVPGIGEKSLMQLKPQITAGTTTAAAAPAGKGGAVKGKK